MRKFQNLKTLLLLSTGIGTLAILLLLYSPLSKAVPTITWTPSKVSQTLNVGESTNISVSFNAYETIGDIAIRVVPELRPFVSVEPDSIFQVTEGTTTEISVTISAAPDAPVGLFDGTIQLRSASPPRRTFAKPLPVMIQVVESSIAGVDANNDGVWDYIENYIEANYPNSSPELRGALRQLAVAKQQALLEADDTAESLENMRATERGIECIIYVTLHEGADLNEGTDLVLDLEAAIVNTTERSNAYLMFTDQLAGQVTRGLPRSQRGTACQ